MRNTIAVMNTKGGVGKSTLVLAIAETLSALHGKTVLIIDSDSQASVSAMLMTANNLHQLQSGGLTIVDLLGSAVLQQQPLDWAKVVVGGVSDVDDARTLYVIPSDMQLTLFEREVSKESQHARLRQTIATLLAATRSVFDVVLIDCPPGLSVLTESWLREADFHIAPTKPDYISACGLEVFRRFKTLNPEMGFAENLGVVINMRDELSQQDIEYERWLRQMPENRCFMQAINRSTSLQHAAHYQTRDRSYQAKYPGEAGQSIRAVTNELLARLAQAQGETKPATQAISAPGPVATSPPAVPPVASPPPLPAATGGLTPPPVIAVTPRQS
jgi:chromosome partitioning protein